MWKLMRGKHQPNAEERQKFLNEFLTFQKSVHHGFPSKPRALAWDPILKIAAIGTATGAIKVFGKCGVEFYGLHCSSSHVIRRLLFIENEGKIISLCDDNTLHLWKIYDTAVVEIKSFTLEGKGKEISSILVDLTKENLLTGTEGGDVYLINLESFTLSALVISKEVVSKNTKLISGAVEVLVHQPRNADNLLIGYRRGLIMLWNQKTSTALQTYINNQQLESLRWDRFGTKFLSSHNDGSYIVWSSESNEPIEEAMTVYGPFRCKAITKIEWCKSAHGEEDILIFSGGMPRASYSDCNAVTIQQGPNLVVLDLTSSVIDFFVTFDDKNEVGESVIILLEEELIAIDLTSPEWPIIPIPYLRSLHASAVTYLTYVNDVTEVVWKKLKNIGQIQVQGKYSTLDWPINGGKIKENIGSDDTHRDLLITGHEDGSVQFWNAGSTVLSSIYTFHTSTIFSTDKEIESELSGSQTKSCEDEWPPLRKVGYFDPFTDDPRLSIKKISFCGSTGITLIAGAAGQIIIGALNEIAVTDKIMKMTVVDLTSQMTDEVLSSFNGTELLTSEIICQYYKKIDRNAYVSLAPGCQPLCGLQIVPPTAVTSVALHADWNLIAAGNAYGFVVYNFETKTVIFKKCHLNREDIPMLNEEIPISRTKSFKKTLRKSFRRIRKVHLGSFNKRRSSKNASPKCKADGIKDEVVWTKSPVIETLEMKPVERIVEARNFDSVSGGIIKCLEFFYVPISRACHRVPTLWAGTNNGIVHILTLSVPGDRKGQTDEITAQLSKEIQLKHKAPVVSINIVKATRKSFSPETNSGQYFVIVCTDEQIKIFSLPNFKSINKLKLTAVEGSKIRRAALGSFGNENATETCLLTLTNLGECIVFSIPDLKRLITAAVIKREDINGITSFMFTKYAEGLYLQSCSEIQRITLSTSRKTIPSCSLMLQCDKSTLRSPEKQDESVVQSQEVLDDSELKSGSVPQC